MDPPESSMFSPSEVLTISVGILLGNVCLYHPKSEYKAKEKPTLQATGMKFNEELGLWFGQQGSHAVHDLNPSFRFAVRAWEETRIDVTADYTATAKMSIQESYLA